ncbi:alcohol dehydrogenase catalytic domain-containing protein [Micromonospora sp. WMMD1102]|uniref:zinc-dependent alcohol dehydrogenase n=1 Tax=Micromonospora sp. WMMD1102 TaxID=3016105 RepID=UPI00241551EF|nr:alcohol dehydrogenase catalytic domain-containing protein [Micromonospora sp. WMMD1102]MDG4791731.1 alcohol dehydrogenase catalytic domain-containing protein [Micromonospora sp. WMMD1102]
MQERSDPVPGPHDVLLRITATGICGSDLHGYTGENGRRHPGQVMGHETVGRVVALGSSVPADLGLVPGVVATVNPVIGCGSCAECVAGTHQRCARRQVIGVDPVLPSAFAELMVAPAGNVVSLPDSLPEEFGALVEPLAVGYHAAVRGEVTPADRVLVIGGGPIGQACALAARRLGAHCVVVTDFNPSRRRLVGRLGFAAVDTTVGDPSERAIVLLGGPATVVLDAVGTTASIEAAFAASSLGARIVLVGMNAPQLSVSGYALSTYERTVIGSFCYTAAEFRETAEWVAAGPAGLVHLIERRVSLAEAPRAFAELATGDLDASKVLVLCATGGKPA